MHVACDDRQCRGSRVKWGEAIWRVIKFASITLLPFRPVQSPPVRQEPHATHKLELVSLHVVVWDAGCAGAAGVAGEGGRNLLAARVRGSREVWLRCGGCCWNGGLKLWGVGVSAGGVNPGAPSCGESCAQAGASAESCLAAKAFIFAGALWKLHNYSVIFFSFTALGVLKYKHMVTGKIALWTQLFNKESKLTIYFLKA